jgi:4'-phosphopantetheinyl transferase EntD
MIQIPTPVRFSDPATANCELQSTRKTLDISALFSWLKMPEKFSMRTQSAEECGTLTRNQDTAKWKREREFELGRDCAKQAMLEIGANGAVLVNADRSPAWPDGVTGSISHSSKIIWAAVASRQTTRSIGIDTEPLIEPKVIASIKKQIVSDQEWEEAKTAMAQLSETELFTALFSAKEAFYKCVYQVNQRFFNFRDAVANFVSDREILIRTHFRKSGPGIQENTEEEICLRVYFEILDTNVFSIVWVEAGELAWT